MNILIIGIGNKLMGDEGVGIHAIEFLRRFKWKENVKLADAGTIGIGLLHLFEDCDHAIIIDATDFGGKPGDVKQFNLEDIKLHEDSAQVSLHGTSLAGVLKLAETLGQKTPKITIFAIQPKTIQTSLGLSDECSKVLQKIPTLLSSLLSEGVVPVPPVSR